MIMGDEDDGRPDDAGFSLFQWGMHGDDGDTDEGNESNDQDESILSNNAEFLQELSLLTIAIDDGVGDNICDLHSAVHQIASPMLCQLLNEKDSSGANTEECRPGNCHDGEKRNGCIICNMIDMRGKNNAVQHNMGSMAQCRGAAGDALREAGAINALLGVLWRLIVPIHVHFDECRSISLLPEIASDPPPKNNGYEIQYTWGSLCNNHLHLQQKNPNFDGIVMNELDTTALDLAISCLGSLRDLSCGSALNRSAVLAWTPPSLDTHYAKPIENGVHVLSAYVKRYDQCKWAELLSTNNGTLAEFESTEYTERGKKELRLLTNALGAIRNTSHSTPDICQEFFNCGLVDILVWRLMPDATLGNPQSTVVTTSLPEASQPWREACFRAASSLINLAEKCPDVAYQLGSNRRLIYLLIETWGGVSAITFDPNKKTRLPLLHLGLAAILHAVGSGALEGGLDDVMVQVLEKEKARKRVAQRKEEERKLRQTKQK